MNEKTLEEKIIETKKIIVALSEDLQHLKASEHKSREKSIVITKLEEAIMWLSKDLNEFEKGSNE